MEEIIFDPKYRGNRSENIKNFQQNYNNAVELTISKKYTEACELLLKCVFSLNPTEFLLIDSVTEIPKEFYINALIYLANNIKSYVEQSTNTRAILLKQNNANRKIRNEELVLTQTEFDLYNASLEYFKNVLQIDFENRVAVSQILSIYTILTYFSHGDLQVSLNFLHQALIISPTSEILHYNLGFIYQKLNSLENSMIHYHISIKLSEAARENSENSENENESTLTGSLTEQELKDLIVNNYNGLASIYRNLKRWPESRFFLEKAKQIKPTDPDILNQLGVVFTEMRRTDLAEECYNLALDNYHTCKISTDPEFLHAEIFLNKGHCMSYDGRNSESLDCYNQALKICPRLHLAFQNKIMNLIYMSNELEDPMYITQQHRLINKLLTKNPEPYTFDKQYFNTKKINIGIVSGDFQTHPVAFFISTFLKNFDTTNFNVTCYSECIINVEKYNKNLNFKIIKGMPDKQVSDLIYNDNIHILIDLAGHTANNKLTVFALKPAPIQINYIGYPFSTGLEEMDYRLTDAICDGDLSISQKFYTEKLICIPDAFMCYDYKDLDSTRETKLPEIKDTPRLKNPKELTIACYNRLNKITAPVIDAFNQIMKECPNVKMVYKTKALINPKVCKEFVNKFDKEVQERITIIPCTLTHNQHVETYNNVDIAIDTWPYSGTTTSCEAISMGVPVFSLYDSEHYMHCQNVTCSILKNSDLDFYICHSIQEIIKKIKILEDKPIEFWETQKETTKSKFFNGKFCNQELYMKNIQKIFVDLFNKHRLEN